MIQLKNINIPDFPEFDSVRSHAYYDASTKVFNIPSEEDEVIDGAELTAFPGLIDPHVHFRTPGEEYKEDWRTAAKATLKGGYTTVFDMPNNIPACITRQRLHDKKAIIEQQLKDVGLPIHYDLYLGADKNHFDEVHSVLGEVIGVKVFMGSSTGDLLMDDDSSLHAVFSIAAHLDLMVAVHAEDECMIQERTKKYAGEKSHHIHSVIRTPEVAARAIEKAIYLSRLYGTRLYILHVSSIPELELIRAAKKEGLSVYAETSPHHLFLNDSFYEKLAGKAQMNPPLRSKEHQPALFEAIHEGVIDTIGSDHAPHTLDEKSGLYGQCLSGVPAMETNFPLLLNAYSQGKISLPEIVKLTSQKVKQMFNYTGSNDVILVDLQKLKTVEESQLKTKCGWSPFAGWELQGWPAYAIIDERLIALDTL